MPIEDVDYLRKNSHKQSYMFVVDSSDRDRFAHPTPSEYVVEFTAPFNHVIGFEVLDASIPRTMYNIDVRNNSLCFCIHDEAHASNVFDPTKYRTVYVEPGDYTIQTLIPAMNRVLSMSLNNSNVGPTVSITAASETNPPELRSIVTFSAPYPFAFDMKASTMAETLGFDLYVDPTEALKTPVEQRYTCYSVSQYPKLYHSKDLDPEVKMGIEKTVFDGPRGVVRKFPANPTELVAQQFTVQTRAYLTQVFAALTTADQTITQDSVVRYQIFTDDNDSPGTLIPLTTPTGDPLEEGLIPISFTDGGYSDIDDAISVELTEGKYWIVFSSDDTRNFVYYNDVPSSLQAGLCKTKQGASPWQNVDTPEGVHFELSLRLVTQDRYHKLIAPGIYSLVGERYIIMRCPEIEESSYRSLAYTKHCLGLAKFRLGVVGYSENRMDFSKVPLREFHPIARLKKITLRFETASGLLYDFKGVNHTITFAIHYYEPLQKQMFENSILNPNYVGNVMEYLYNRDEQESDEQDYDYNRDALEDYQVQEARYLPENVRRRDLDALYEFDD